MNKPKLEDFVIKVGEKSVGIDFVGYAFALEEYCRELEEMLRSLEAK